MINVALLSALLCSIYIYIDWAGEGEGEGGQGWDMLGPTRYRVYWSRSGLAEQRDRVRA